MAKPKTLTHDGRTFTRTAQGITLAPSHIADRLASIVAARPLTLEKPLTGSLYGVPFILTRAELKALNGWRLALEVAAADAHPSKPRQARPRLGGSVGQGRCPVFHIKASGHALE